MNYPDDATLIARGKQATLKKERWEQIERVQKICRSVQGDAALIMTDVQKKPPEDDNLIDGSIQALENALKARERIKKLDEEIDALNGPAWGAI